MASSKKWARILSRIASRIYFILIIFQFPFFRVPCRTGICTTPIEVTSSQLIASEVFPAVVVKALLYPGAIANAVIKNTTIPSYDNLLNVYALNKVKRAPTKTDLQHLEVLVGSYFSVAGALLGLLKSGRVSLFGTLLILWGLAKEVILRKHAGRAHSKAKAVHIYPAMSLAVVSAFFSIRGDVRKIIRSCKAKRIAKSLWPYGKAKYN
ncbi:hypothetical protein F0562_024609 [Nyssa sinensis]|uniref:Uncharacterized protein n=1 Tax=Nyssa sinensis TaxID=561372 RepID=A0A5J5BF74_9ASTE|nr:hypothetical protein F0562_024609 [Nyssa sinensis]